MISLYYKWFMLCIPVTTQKGVLDNGLDSVLSYNSGVTPLNSVGLTWYKPKKKENTRTHTSVPLLKIIQSVFENRRPKMEVSPLILCIPPSSVDVLNQSEIHKGCLCIHKAACLSSHLSTCTINFSTALRRNLKRCRGNKIPYWISRNGTDGLKHWARNTGSHLLSIQHSQFQLLCKTLLKGELISGAFRTSGFWPAELRLWYYSSIVFKATCLPQSSSYIELMPNI